MIFPAELATMQAIASERWRTHGPYVAQHVGDLAWAASGPGCEDVGALLVDGGYAFTDGAHWSLGGRDDAMPELVEAARAAGAAVWALETEHEKVGLLREAGFTSDYEGFWHFVHDLADLPPLPPGVVSGTEDPERRVALHQAAWQSGRFTAAHYERLRATPPYRADLDVVVGWRAYALAWLDEGSASGLLEPVGTDPAFRRQGHGTAACVAALHRLRDAGARTVVVHGATDAAYPAPRALYRSLGFVAVDRHVRYVPPASGAPPAR